MDNNEVKMLINTFKEYRDLLTPIEQNLKEFSVSFESISSDLNNLNNGFDGNIKDKLDKIYKELSGQADKARTLSAQVDSFAQSTNKYVSAVDRLINICSKIEEKINIVDKIQNEAESQIERLNVIIEDKKKTYNLKQLEKNLENYNVSVQKVSEYINKDVADTLKTNSDTIGIIFDKNESIYQSLIEEKSSIENLVASYNESNKLLKKVVENNDINEEYLFEILDKWAENRKIKTKK